MKKLKVNTNFIDIVNMDTFLKKLNGLMWKKSPINKAYLFKKTNGIHTFFMFQNIDVILTDKNYKILYIKENMKPFRVLFPKKNIYYTIELPLNISKCFNVGETLTIEEK